MIVFHEQENGVPNGFFPHRSLCTPPHSAGSCAQAPCPAPPKSKCSLLAVGSSDFKTSDLPRQAWERDTITPGKTAAAAQCQLNKVVTSGAKTCHSSAASAALKRSTATNYSRFHHPLHYKTRRFAKTGSGQTQENPIEKRPKTQNREFYVFSLFAVRGIRRYRVSVPTAGSSDASRQPLAPPPPRLHAHPPVRTRTHTTQTLKFNLLSSEMYTCQVSNLKCQVRV